MSIAPYTVVLHKRLNYQNFGLYITEDVPSGIYIVTIEPNSPAAQSTLQPGDRVLAVNGQLVSTMTKNPKAIVMQMANEADILTLSIQPSDVLQVAGLFSMNNNFQYTSPLMKGIDQNLEDYIKSILNGHVQKHPLLSLNGNEYISTMKPPSTRSRPSRKRRSQRTVQTQTSFTNEPKENLLPVFRRRSIPSMGTSHAILRNLQLNTKESETTEVSESLPAPSYNSTISQLVPPILPSSSRVLSPPASQPRLVSSPLVSNNPPYTQGNFQPPTEESSTRPSMAQGDGLHEIRIRRSPNFQGFGFHLQYNKIFYVIHHIEPNSPAERSGLRPQDVIRRINNRSTDGMAHKDFVQMIHDNDEVLFLVQTYDNYIRTNPDVLRQQMTRRSTVSGPNYSTTYQRPQNVLSKALSKLTSR